MCACFFVPLQCQKEEEFLLPHEAVQSPTCTKEFSLVNPQFDLSLATRKHIYKPNKPSFRFFYFLQHHSHNSLQIIWAESNKSLHLCRKSISL